VRSLVRIQAELLVIERNLAPRRRSAGGDVAKVVASERYRASIIATTAAASEANAPTDDATFKVMQRETATYIANAGTTGGRAVRMLGASLAY
jgi:hypothetical protein